LVEHNSKFAVFSNDGHTFDAKDSI